MDKNSDRSGYALHDLKIQKRFPLWYDLLDLKCFIPFGIDFKFRKHVVFKVRSGSKSVML